MTRKIGILTSGGDAPGMNASIRAVTRAALGKGYEVFGIYDGYKGLVEGQIKPMDRHSVSDIIIRGGTILGTARLDEFKADSVQDEAVEQLHKYDIDSLVVIGGDGSYRGAADLSKKGINTIGLPGTIDNDAPGTEFTIGFFTALTTVVECVDKLRDTSTSHHRCSVIEVMGNHCGDLCLYSAICSGAELAITPEQGYDEEKIIHTLAHLEEVKKKRHAIVMLTEKMTNADLLAKKISAATGFSSRVTVLGHIQRGGSPVPFDRILATRIGDYAVEILSQGKTSQCIGIINNQLVATPIEQALQIPKTSRQPLVDMFERLI